MRPTNKRSRSKQNRPRTLGNIVNRVFDSSGPEGKVRGTPQQIIDKYALLARDAQLSGDRVAAENFLQHAEHYTRMLNEAQAEMARETDQRRDSGYQQNGQQGQTRRFEGQGESDGDAPESEGQQGEARSYDGRSNDGRSNEPRSSEARPADGRQNDGRQTDSRPAEPRADQPRSDGRTDWKERRNKRFEDRRTRRDATDPRDDAARPAQTGDAESMLVETPESRAETRSEPQAEARAVPQSAPPVEAARPQPAIEPAAEPAPAAAATEPADAAPKPRVRKPRKPRAEGAAEAPTPTSDAATSDAAE